MTDISVTFWCCMIEGLTDDDDAGYSSNAKDRKS